jgi:hypothetical protein
VAEGHYAFKYLYKKGAKTHYKEIPLEFLVPKFAWRIFGTLVARYSAFLYNKIRDFVYTNAKRLLYPKNPLSGFL